MRRGSTPYALLFPGQGNQYPGMGLRAYGRSRRARAMFDEAERIAGMPIRRLCFEASRAELARTQVTQPCLLVASLAAVAALEEELEIAGSRLAPRFAAGHSLGHYAALVAAGAASFAGVLELVCVRAELMAATGDGAMASIVGLGPEQVTDICVAVTGSVVVMAAVNGPCHTVVSGERVALAAVLDAARDAGAARTVVLPVSVAAHTPTMSGAQRELASHIEALDLAPPRFALVLNGTARPTRSTAEIRTELELHTCATVMWWPSVQTMLALGVRLLVDTGPGRVLTRSLGAALGESAVIGLEQPGAALALALAA
jgi:[acyl-carrier-protein] S-malonyltransferase